jgi:hypothetical protein
MVLAAERLKCTRKICVTNKLKRRSGTFGGRIQS